MDRRSSGVLTFSCLSVDADVGLCCFSAGEDSRFSSLFMSTIAADNKPEPDLAGDK